MRRKRNRLSRESYVGRRWYFITICTEDRQAFLSNGRLVGNLLDCLREKCRAETLDVYAYCFMPDHLHLELVGLSESSSLVALLKGFKGKATSIGRRDGIRNLWEKGFYDHVLREGENVNAVAWYIFNNPVRKGLAKDPRDWPYSGSWMFDWKKAVTPPEEFVPPWK
jgi:putative transposase